MHLANIDCGQFIYLRPQITQERPIVFSPYLNSANTHNIIVISAGANAVIEERMVNDTLLPSYEGTEILVGLTRTLRTDRQIARPVKMSIGQSMHTKPMGQHCSLK